MDDYHALKLIKTHLGKANQCLDCHLDGALVRALDWWKEIGFLRGMVQTLNRRIAELEQQKRGGSSPT